jgi:tetratricopeptide (TPR) repeat protein
LWGRGAGWALSVKETAELKQLLEWQEQRWGQDHSKVIATLEVFADLLQMQGKYGDAEPIYWQVLEKKHKLYGASDLRVADTIYDIASLHEMQENWDECERLYKWTCDIRCKLLPKDDPQLEKSKSKAREAAEKCGHEIEIPDGGAPPVVVDDAVKFDWNTHLDHSRMLVMERKYEAAERILNCLADVAEVYEPGSRMQADCLHLLGRVQFHQRSLAESLKSFEKTLAVYEVVSGTSSRETAACLEDMADVHCKLAEQPEAEFLLNWALQIHEALDTDEQHRSRLKVKLESLPVLCTPVEELPEEEPDLPSSEPVPVPLPAGEKESRQAAKKEQLSEPSRLEQIANDGSPESQDQVAHFLWTRWMNTGKAALEKGDLVGAEMMLSRGLDKANEFGCQDPRLWQTLCDMAELHIKQSKFVKAESMYTTAQQYCEKSLGPMHPKNAIYWEKLGKMYESQGDNAQAVVCFDKLVTILVKDNRPLVEYGSYLKKLERLHEKAPASFYE